MDRIHFHRVNPRSGTRECSDIRVDIESVVLTGRWYEEFKNLNHEDPKDTKEEGIFNLRPSADLIVFNH